MLTEAESLFSGLNIAQICAEFRAKEFNPEDCQDDGSRADLKIVRADGSIVLIEAKRAWSYELLGQCVAHVHSETECDVVGLVTHDLTVTSPSQMNMPGRWVQLRVLRSLWAMGVKTYSVGRGRLEVVTRENVECFISKEYLPGLLKEFSYRYPIGPKPEQSLECRARKAASAAKPSTLAMIQLASALTTHSGGFTVPCIRDAMSSIGGQEFLGRGNTKGDRAKMLSLGWIEKSHDAGKNAPGTYRTTPLGEEISKESKLKIGDVASGMDMARFSYLGPNGNRRGPKTRCVPNGNPSGPSSELTIRILKACVDRGYVGVVYVSKLMKDSYDKAYRKVRRMESRGLLARDNKLTIPSRAGFPGVGYRITGKGLLHMSKEKRISA